MSPAESFDDLEQKLSARMEEALAEIREEFLDRLQAAHEQLGEVVKSELVTAQEAAAVAAASEAEAEEARAALLAEAEEAKIAAIAEALEAKEAEFSEILGARDAAIAEAEQARDAALTEAEEARAALLAEAEEARSNAIAEAVAAKESELQEILAAKDSALAEAEEARVAALATAAEEKEVALAAAAEEREAALAEAQAATAKATDEAVVGTILHFHEIVTKLDKATTQTEVLEALLVGSRAFASRSILFLTREDGLQGWGGQGFDTPEGHLQQTHLDYTDGSAWAELAEGRGTVKMDPDACAGLCRAVDGSRPAEGVLVPLVLRDRLAAALYADRLDDESPFLLAVLQLLTYIAAQVLESLPVRQRTGTPTLRLASETAAEVPGIELWQFLAPEEPIEEPVPIPAVADELAVEQVVEERPTFEETPELEPAPWAEPIETAGFEVEPVAEPAVDEPVIEEPTVVAEEPVVEVEPPVEAAPPTQISPPTEVEPPTAVTPPTSEVAPPTAVTPPAAGAEVAAPDDVDGPGWAFTTRRFSADGPEDASHEEARRLARLLVTEIKLYNEEQVEEGRRSRNIYRTLKEDIDRSRQIYEERVEEAVRLETDYFQEELVKILAAGDAEVLGT